MFYKFVGIFLISTGVNCQELQFENLPKDMKNEIFKEMLFSLIKEEDKPVEDKIVQIIKWAGLNREFREFFGRYIDINNLPNLQWLYTDTLLEAAIEFNWDKLYEFIFKNIELTKEEKKSANNVIDSKDINNTKFLILSESDIDRALLEAIEKNNIHCVKYAILNGADVNGDQNSLNIFELSNHTPLMAASYMGNKNIVKLLLAKGADKSLRDNNGWSALQYAQYAGHKNIVELLNHADLGHGYRVCSIV